MSMLNDYLNGYTEKLARATTTEPSSIKIDQQHFSKIVKSVNASTFNPYREFEDIKNEIKELDKKHQAMALLQKKQAEEYKALGIHQEDEIEEADTMAQLKHITKAHKEDTNLKQTKQYSKGLSVN